MNFFEKVIPRTSKSKVMDYLKTVFNTKLYLSFFILSSHMDTHDQIIGNLLVSMLMLFLTETCL